MPRQAPGNLLGLWSVHGFHSLTSARLQVKDSENTPLITCLLEGPAGSGKTGEAQQPP